ncbi:single-stranded DNA binding protein Ssb2 [Schizosaccharomyces cryophilus OY26]|uniref:Single-stranded DNA binding protein Ssb2 n=1 Tax=Schizosaccharomyces cryophilus (strain OY26 / ATCC MYA-4695 / CBS 11777 / NBRC 106824 / NRRL Y48691) TaxID=653667 RepID=S9VZZ4_SCHCR|nr:single-stranded DNA binding protein Ssb2 [Schizosaccharomyces cryophilus OY26]EPY51325.1 single-stranded DNA binding protein Ssb2 [Schizosaccharomyces cryophilus OY26]
MAFDPYNKGGYGSGFNGTFSPGMGGGGFNDYDPSSQPSVDRQQGIGNKLRPVTIKQILDATQVHADAEFKIDGVEVGQVTFVGVLRNIHQQTTNTTYQIEDGTGMIEVRHWEHIDALSELATDTYVRVYGNIKVFSGKIYIASQYIRNIKDHNEIHYHFLEAISVHVHFTQKPQLTGTAPSAFGNPVPNAGSAPASNSLEQKLAEYSLTPTQMIVMQAIHNAPDTNEGVHVRQLAQSVGPGIDLTAVTDFLQQEGIIYTTIDENHFKSVLQDQ